MVSLRFFFYLSTSFGPRSHFKAFVIQILYIDVSFFFLFIFSYRFSHEWRLECLILVVVLIQKYVIFQICDCCLFIFWQSIIFHFRLNISNWPQHEWVHGVKHTISHWMHWCAKQKRCWNNWWWLEWECGQIETCKRPENQIVVGKYYSNGLCSFRSHLCSVFDDYIGQNLYYNIW